MVGGLTDQRQAGEGQKKKKNPKKLTGADFPWTILFPLLSLACHTSTRKKKTEREKKS